MDCAPQIAQAIEESIPQAQILWCGVHVLRAILRKSNKFSSQEKFEQFYNLMKDLVFKLDAEHEEEANAAYDQVLELLDTDPTHLNTLTDNGVTTYQDGLLVTGVKATQLTILPKLILEHSNMTIFLIEKISELMMLL
ncbi:hypothetical protein TVAG_465660 [Trichomonas vaginalis G3]|uniref:MULE transposase domain-containing protein n=1 Tax=Trichomonas vaginalis (strain ATCC PRA-98 / G3) TaxID=412133 RepID=A2GHU6_TRIV3|nr:hypothetical protein TVAG_465660 [Trichomonas vaginalis G3]|eukprot:XP_001296201.1 hypothetical protein [Trichomonas vaginalis G3]